MIVYCWLNLLNGKCYVGITKYTIEYRIKTHLKCIKGGDNKPLYKAIRKYGLKNFIIEELQSCNNWSELCIAEKFWIIFFDSFRNGYNLTLGGDGTDGYKHSKESIQKIKIGHLGQKAWNKGLNKENDERLLIHSRKMKGKNNPNYGRTAEKHPLYGIKTENNPKYINTQLDNYEFVYNLYIIENKSANEIAKMFNMCKTTVRGRIAKLGIRKNRILTKNDKRKKCNSNKSLDN